MQGGLSAERVWSGAGYGITQPAPKQPTPAPRKKVPTQKLPL